MEVREINNLSTVVLSLLGSGVSTISLIATSCAVVVLEYALYSNGRNYWLSSKRLTSIMLISHQPCLQNECKHFIFINIELFEF
jgi:hypothetical protein